MILLGIQIITYQRQYQILIIFVDSVYVNNLMKWSGSMTVSGTIPPQVLLLTLKVNYVNW